MTRKKVKLAFIANDSSRKTTFKKRKMGLMKKVKELATLCGITACAIIYSPYDANPEVWPSNSGVEKVIAEFRTLPEMDQHKKMVDQETFLLQRIVKATEHLKRQKKENRELEMIEIMFNCLIGRMGMFSLNIIDLNDLGYLIDQYLKNVKHRIEILANSGMDISESSNADAEGVGTITVVAATTAPTVVVYEAGSSSSSAPAVAFFKPVQQHQYQLQPQPQPKPHQFRYPRVSHSEFYEKPQNLTLSQNQNQTQQQWFMEMMNNHEHMSFVAEQMGLTLMDDNHHEQIPDESFTAPTAFSNSIIPVSSNHNHHYYQPQLPHQQIPENFSPAPASASSSSIIPVTEPNLTNNIWSR